MRALVATGDLATLAALQEVKAPVALPNQLVIEVAASSVNHGELEWLSRAAAGWRPGWDAAGVVLEPAADGSGPPRDSRVAAFLSEGAWGERVAVASGRAGVIPDGLDFTTAAGIPVAGLTALRALRIGGLPAGQRVLVLGATGAIGRVAVQLACRAGARVTAAVRSAGAAEELQRLGAEAAIGDEAFEAGYDLILDAVGGPALAAALGRLAPGGVAVVFGDAAHSPTVVDTGKLFLNAPEARIHALRMDASAHPERFAADIAHLASLVERGELELGLAQPVGWACAPEVLNGALRERPARKPILAMAVD